MYALRRLTLSALASLCVLVGVLAFASAPAMAKLIHVYSTSFATGPCVVVPVLEPCEGKFDEPAGVAVNETTGDVYVVDKGNNRVEEFNSTGTFLGEFNGAAAPTGAFSEPEAIAVDNSTNPLDPSAGDVYVTDRGHNVVDKFEADGTYVGQIAAGEGGAPLEELDGVAVDKEGKVWVYQGSRQIADYTNALLNGFISSHEEQAGGGPQPGGLAVDSEDRLYFITRGRKTAERVSSEGQEETAEFGKVEEEVSGIAVDVPTNNVYLDRTTDVSEFEPDGSAIETFGSGRLTAGSGVAVNYSTGNASSGTVYVADSAGDDVAVFGTAVVPDVAVESVTGFTTTTATLKGTVDPDNTSVTGCEFEYGTEPGVFTSKAACSPALPYSGSAPVAVSATAIGLTGGDTYYYRLSATNANGANQSTEANFLQPKPVLVEGESTSFVEAKAATLEATINPGGSATTYRFEVGSAAGSYSVSVPAVNGPTKPSLTSVAVLGRATGLSPGTTYHFRVVAENALPGAVDGSDESFSTLTPLGNGSPESCPNARLREEQPYAGALPDCRAYEMVSPLEKANTGVAPLLARASVSSENPAITFDSKGSFGEAAGAYLDSRYVARRGASGWSTKNITPLFKAGGVEGFTPFDELLFTPGLTEGVLKSKETPLTETQEGFTNTYVANLQDSSYELLTPQPPGVKPFEFGAPSPVTAGASSDLSRVFFEEEAALTPEAPNSRQMKLYESTGGHTSLVSVEPDGKPFSGEALLGYGIRNPGPVPIDASHAVSEDGQRAFFTAEGQLYVRENPEQPQSPLNGSGECTVPPDACTVEVSASQPGVTDPNGPQPARFWAANADATKVFFTSNAELTDDAKTGPDDNAANLYEYELPQGSSDGKLTDLTVDSKDADGAAVLGVVGNGVAEDGSYVYFVAQGVLSEVPNGEGATPSAGSPNLYAFHNGEIEFIAALAQEDEADWSGSPVEANAARVSADGTHLAFISTLGLAGANSEEAAPGDCSNQNRELAGDCDEVYLYDAGSGGAGSLECASCAPSGALSIGPSELGGRGEGSEEREKVYQLTYYQTRNLSEDGSRLFFQSPNALTQQGANGLISVYEYEDGHAYPLSNVAGARNSYFLDASASGNDVFIVTADPLVPGDTDDLGDVYDVRVDGGFPAPGEPKVCNNAEACKGGATSQPQTYGPPASATFSGPGNQAPPPPTAVKVKTAAQLKAEKLAKALKVCAKDKHKSKRAKCQKQARQKYGASKAKKSAQASRRAGR